jgi:MerR family mercuric resistance operon transcriptional regulator
METQKKLTIGRLAVAAGVGVETVRFYERKGMVKKPRSAGGYREYTPGDAIRIRFIRRAQDLGFTLREIKGLLDFYVSRDANCADIRDIAEAKVAEINAKIEDLNRMKKSLMRIVTACGSGKKAVSQCKLLECFESGCEC